MIKTVGQLRAWLAGTPDEARLSVDRGLVIHRVAIEPAPHDDCVPEAVLVAGPRAGQVNDPRRRPAILATHGGDPRHYVWREHGRLWAGTLAEYGLAYSASHSWPAGDIGEELRTWDTTYQVTATRQPNDTGPPGSWPVRLTVPGETVTIRVYEPTSQN